MSETNIEYKEVIEGCKSLFMQKSKDYGLSWKVLRLPSLTDQIMIKLDRIRTIQETGVNLVGDSITSEFIAVANYCAIALMSKDVEVCMDNLEESYNAVVQSTFELMRKKNHDYGESWRKMRISSLTDLMLMKVARLKQIEDNQGKTLVSEGVAANYMDILNYAVFCLIRDNGAKETVITTKEKENHYNGC